MSTLKERIIKRIEKAMETRRIELGNFQEIKARIEQFNGLEIEVDEKDADIYISSYGSFTLYCVKPGLGQEMANCLTVDLEMEFTKGFDGETGQHYYSGRINNPYMSFFINAVPPESCKVQWVEEEETRIVRRAKANCE